MRCRGSDQVIVVTAVNAAEDDPFNGEEGAPLVAGYCPLYRLSDQGHCAGYGWHSYYLGGCNVWPDHPEQIADKPGCTYSFEWRD